MRIHRRYGERETVKKNTFSVLNAYFSSFSPFSSVCSSNCPLQQRAPNQRYLLNYVTKTQLIVSVLYTDLCEHSHPHFFSLSSSFLFLPYAPLFILQWLTCFTSTAVISTAFTELINGAEGWVLLNWDDSFSLSLAHMVNYIEKKRMWCKKRWEGEINRRIHLLFFCLVPEKKTGRHQG